MANVQHSGYTMVRLTRREAEYLMMAPAAAGGWVAVHPDCREAVDEVFDSYYGDGADFLALLPSEWDEAKKRRVKPEQARLLATRLDAHAKYSVVDEPEVPRDFARRVRDYLDQMKPERDV